MHLILVPGFWLGGWSWDRVTPFLTAAGRHVHSPTLPGLESVHDDRSGIGLAEHVAAVTDLVDSLEANVVLVGHSGGGTIIHAAVDRRPDQVRHAIYVDSGPTAHGAAINTQLAAEGDDVPLPPWREFESVNLRGLNEETLNFFRANAVPQPRGVARDPQILNNEARFDVPVTLIATTITMDEVRRGIADGDPDLVELGRIKHHGLSELPTGHWPQFSRPEDLAEAILDAW